MVESDIVLLYIGPMSGGSSMQWNSVWQLYALKGLFPVMYDRGRS
jgi:hypothetical protein